MFFRFKMTKFGKYKDSKIQIKEVSLARFKY